MLTLELGKIKTELANWSRHIECAKKSDFRHIDNYEQLVLRLLEVAQNVLDNHSAKSIQKVELPSQLTTSAKGKRKRKRKGNKTIKVTPNEYLSILRNLYLPKDVRPAYVKNTVGFISSLDLNINKLMKQLNLTEEHEKAMIQRLAIDTKPFSIEQYLKGDDGQWHSVVHDYTPASHLLYNGKEPFEIPYNKKAAPSMERDTQHAVNMYAYKMSIDNNVVDQYTRVGSPYAHMESSKSVRKKISHQRWREILINILVTEKQDELDRIVDNPGSSAEIELPIVYSNLMSPDVFRKPGAKVAKFLHQEELAKVMDAERNWIKNIHTTMESLHQVLDEQGQLALSINGVIKKVKVNLRAFMFVTPCNQLAFKKYFDPNGKLWKLTHEINIAELQKLTGKKGTYGGYLGEKINTLTQDEKKEAKELTDWLWKNVNKKNSIAFGIKVRRLLSILGVSHMLGCKSNKDRTGRICATDQGVKISACFTNDEGASCHSDQDNQISSEWESYQMIHGGHVQIQQYCTGVPGSKIDVTVKPGIDMVFDVIQRKEILPTEFMPVDDRRK